MTIDLKKISNNNYKNEIMEAINFMMNEFPCLKFFVDNISVRRLGRKFRNCYMTCNTVYIDKHMKVNININEEFVNDDELEDSFINTRLSRGSYGSSLTTTIKHEFGHAINFILASYDLGFNIFNPISKKNFRKILEHSSNIAIVECERAFMAASIPTKNINDVIDLFGRQGAQSYSELFAEAITQYYYLNSNLESSGSLSESEMTAFKIADYIVNSCRTKLLLRQFKINQT